MISKAEGDEKTLQTDSAYLLSETRLPVLALSAMNER